MIPISTSELRETLAEVVNRVIYGGNRYVLRRHQKEVAVIVSMSDWEKLQELSGNKVQAKEDYQKVE